MHSTVIGVPINVIMQSAQNDDGWDRVECLVAELRAIEHWNAEYWRKGNPETYEMLALVARRQRRAEILSQLLTLLASVLLKLVAELLLQPREQLSS
jgi:hypothetical protein